MSTRKNPRLKNRIKDLCDETGITPADLSRRIGRAQSTVSQYVTGERFPAPDAIVSICDELQRGVGDVFYVDPPTEKISTNCD